MKFERFDGEMLSRRAFLQTVTAAGAGLTLAIHGAARAADAAAGAPAAALGKAATEPMAYLRIGADNTVTVIVKHLEMGQGTFTGIPTLVAEELDAAWFQVRAEGAPADASRYNNLSWGPVQGTGGSSSLSNSFMQYRQAGAAARAMLVAAAAELWKVDPATLVVHEGVVSHPAGKRANFGQLATAAAKQPVPRDVKLKDPAAFRLIGKHGARTDSAAKSRGKATFTQDVKLPGMLTAVVRHPDRFGAKVKSFDAAAVRNVPGVRFVVEVPNGVAVVATTFWAAKKGRDALKVEWDDSGFAASSGDILAEYRKLAKTPGASAAKRGDAAAKLAAATKRIDAEFSFPYLAHAAMEPLNCVVKLGATSCEVWNGEQFHTADQAAVAGVVGLKPEQVAIHQVYAGGSFGRRASTTSDYVVEAASIAQGLAKTGKLDIPVKLVWTREDDMTAGYYRPAYVHTLSAGIDASGNVAGWQHRIVGQSILAGSPMAGMIRNGVDVTSVEGAANLPYAIADFAVDLHSPQIGVPVLWWRSVGSTHTAFSTEVIIDELAAAAGKDAVAFRAALLADKPRHKGVLELAAQKAGWGSPLAPAANGAKRGRGIAVHESFNTFVAEVVEVTVGADNAIKVDRVVCAVDCGLAVNPDVVRAQMEGGIGFALSAALYGEITLKDGVVEQTNFHQYPVLRIGEMPVVDVHIVPSQEKPTGVGEPGVPPLAPALANAIAAATGKRLRALPIKLA